MRKIIALLAASMLLLSACSTATLDGAGKELEDTIANATDADNKYVQMVKGGYPVDNPDVTYEDAFSAFFGTPRWKYFESEDGQDVVEFTGDCSYQDVPVKARIQFVVDEENGTFEASYLAFNEVPQNALTLAAVISKAFESVGTVDAGDGQGQSSNTAGQILIHQIPAQDVIRMSADEVIAAFGEPEIYMENYSVEYGADAPEWMYFDVSNGNTVAAFDANAGEFTLNGQSLKQNFDALVSLMGDDYNSLGAGGYQWIREGISYTFYIPDDTEPYSISVCLSSDNDALINNDNDTYLETNDIEENYASLDSKLVGRWRAYDGSYAEFDEYGHTSVSFKAYPDVANPNDLRWEADNGRLMIVSYFSERLEYEFTDQLLALKSDNGAESYYSRDETGDSLVGTWDGLGNSIIGSFSRPRDGSLVLNSDGTGTTERGTDDLTTMVVPMTWYNDDTYLYTQWSESLAYDYTVSGDVLTIFSSNGSQSYTRVGN